MKEVKYDTPIEVSEEEYRYLTSHFSGSIAHRKENGKFFIKVWYRSVFPYIQRYLNRDIEKIDSDMN